MAKFRQGDLRLTNTQKIIQGSSTILNASGAGRLNSLTFIGGGATVTEFSTDDTLAGNSDTVVPTEKAIKSFVDTKVGVTIPAGVDNAVATYDGTSAIQASPVFIDDLGNVVGVADLDVGGLATITSMIFGGGGATISEFSIDGTLGGDSDTVVPTEKAVKTYVDGKLGGSVGAGTDNRAARYDGASSIQSSLVEITDDGDVSGIRDLTVSRNLFVDGTTFTVHNQEVTTSDNMIVINNGEAGAGVTAGYAGIEVDRGSLTNYRFIFDESQDNFRIGEIGDLQAVATREDSPTADLIPYWNGIELRFDTANSPLHRIDDGVEVYDSTANNTLIATLDVNHADFDVPLRVTSTSKVAGHFYAGTTDPTVNTRLNYDGDFHATKVYGAVWG